MAREKRRQDEGRPKADVTFDWQRVVRLTDQRGKKVERLAARREIPVATMLRMLVNERLDQIEDGA